MEKIINWHVVVGLLAALVGQVPGLEWFKLLAAAICLWLMVLIIWLYFAAVELLFGSNMNPVLKQELQLGGVRNGKISLRQAYRIVTVFKLFGD